MNYLSLLAFATTTTALVALKTGIVVPLGVSCVVLLALIPSAAARGKLSVPIYALLALASGLLAFIAGHMAGAASIHGTPLGVVVSIIFFLLVASGLGCFLGIIFYRHPDEEAEASPSAEEAPAAGQSPESSDQ